MLRKNKWTCCLAAITVLVFTKLQLTMQTEGTFKSPISQDFFITPEIRIEFEVDISDVMNTTGSSLDPKEQTFPDVFLKILKIPAVSAFIDSSLRMFPEVIPLFYGIYVFIGGSEGQPLVEAFYEVFPSVVQSMNRTLSTIVEAFAEFSVVAMQQIGIFRELFHQPEVQQVLQKFHALPELAKLNELGQAYGVDILSGLNFLETNLSSYGSFILRVFGFLNFLNLFSGSFEIDSDGTVRLIDAGTFWKIFGIITQILVCFHIYGVSEHEHIVLSPSLRMLYQVVVFCYIAYNAALYISINYQKDKLTGIFRQLQRLENEFASLGCSIPTVPLAGKMAHTLKTRYHHEFIYSRDKNDGLESLQGVLIIFNEINAGNVGIRGLGFFTISYGFIGSVLSLIATYAIVAIQMNVTPVEQGA
ncbi:unnamed protein product, partial [Allacma fusca]